MAGRRGGICWMAWNCSHFVLDDVYAHGQARPSSTARSPTARHAGPMTLAVRDFRALGYRSLKSIAYPMSGLDVFVGANGVGKTNLYRALELLQSAARNTLAEDLAREGGFTQAMWAGPRRAKEQPELKLEVGLADPYRHGSGSV